ncbi:TPA: hypothetical protein HA239_04325 [Candidatus Woesearchaeota archaeon]|nr:hypothetical protein QT06_C0001G0716 [archaeon GW2011_AR15]MBS3103498.1 hypothetical protein [Candidatus Woesearchaeota archaeon]HIH41616.1 hypothetical protein [Candidatus Woesearchaeota archaeon]
MRTYTREQLLFYLTSLSKELKKTPTIDDMNRKKDYPSAATLAKRFGSWNNALRKAGLKVNVRKKYTKTELLDNLKLLAKELGRQPKSTDLKGKKWAASYTTYKKHFGSWKKALDLAGVTESRVVNLRKFSGK